MIGRDEIVRKIKDRLILAAWQNDVSDQTIIVIQGLFGMGMTTLVAYLAHDPEIRAAFRDGVLWASLGQSPKLRVLAQLYSWGSIVNLDLTGAGSIKEASNRLANRLRGKRMLIIIDDVWDSRDAQPFLVGRDGCAMIVTTRSDDVTKHLDPRPQPDDIHTLPVLRDDQALLLLEMIVPEIVAQHPQTCLELVRRLGRSPLALQVAGRLLQAEASSGFGIDELLPKLRENTRILKDQVPAVLAGRAGTNMRKLLALVQTSIERLTLEDRRLFAFLSFLAARPVRFDLEAMRAIWQIQDPQPVVDRLFRRGLLDRTGYDRFRMRLPMQLLAARIISGAPNLLKELEGNTIRSLQDASRHFERLVLFSECLLNLEPGLGKEWNMGALRSEALDALRKIIRREENEPQRRIAAFLLTRLRWLTELPVSELEACLELVMRYLDLREDRIFLVEYLTDLLKNQAKHVQRDQRIHLLVYLAINQAELGQLDDAEKSYKTAWRSIGSSVPAPNKVVSRIKLGLGGIARDRMDESYSSRNQPLPTWKLQRIEKLYLDAVKFAQGQDTILEVNTHKEFAYAYTLFGEWSKAEHYCDKAGEILETGKKRRKPIDEQVYSQYRVKVLETKSDMYLREGREQSPELSLISYDKAYTTAQEQIQLLEQAPQLADDQGLIFAHITAGDALWGRSKCIQEDESRSTEDQAHRHWTQALDIARTLGISEERMIGLSIFPAEMRLNLPQRPHKP